MKQIKPKREIDELESRPARARGLKRGRGRLARRDARRAPRGRVD